VLESIARALVDALDVSACAISRVVGDLLVDIAGHSRNGKQVFLGYGYLVSDYPLTREVIVGGAIKTLSLRDAGADEREARLLRELGYDSLLMLPLPVCNGVWGLVEVYATGARRFGPRDLALAEQLVGEAGAALDALGANATPAFAVPVRPS
jgi:GAF domain-containing protein